ncbi:MAG: ribosome biogenesis GTPase YlqF [Peptococcaceae bacterium]|nr:ribosome biogenesis GTPase YlqF [Peptococcaceae bacterium]
MDIQWFPGHMAKARRMIEKEMRLVDVVIELRDARIPESSRNPLLNEIIGKKKPRLIVLNKADLADANRTQYWINQYKSDTRLAIAVNATSGRKKLISAVVDALHTLTAEKRERFQSKGATNVPIRVMVVGIPNVGKSTFINMLLGRGATTTGNKPGVTKGKQWVRLTDDIELLDTPGILWHKFDDQEAGNRLAMTGAISDEVFVFEEVVFWFLKFAQEKYPALLASRYELDEDEVGTMDTYALMQTIGRKRGAIVRGNKVDDLKTARIIMKDYRDSKIGRMSLE